MTYKDLILRLLQNRPQLNVFEDVLLDEFAGQPDPRAALEAWCARNGIALTRRDDSKLVTLEPIRSDVNIKAG